ncbi:MAG: glycosyltransferase [Planctomycetes bacterium]|nr:glycosyltransferase [Planctomycetota bacterium]MCW8137396.1 glycosyltransferase family 4 protein [Planctomycetota bacterium]
MIVAHEIQQLGLGGTEKTMLLFLRHLRALGVQDLHAFAPRDRETGRAEQVAKVAELHLYEDLDDLVRRLRVLQPHILHRHRSGYADPLDQVNLGPRTRIVETNVYGDHGSRADLRLFVSRTVAQEQAWPGPLEVLYNPCERPVPGAAIPRSHRRFPEVNERDVERVVVFGRVGRPSAHIYDPIALEAYARVESPWTRYVALAPPPNMVDHARWLGLRTFVALPPTIDEWELSRVYSLFDVLAHARRDGETCGMNIQEAMIHGLPVITHLSDTHNAQPEVLGEGYPWIAARGDRDAYTRFMAEAVTSPERRVALGERNRRRAEQEFEAGRVAERLLTHYQTLVAS